jgi:hypothetical protein
MAGSVVITPSSVQVVPGAQTSATVKIRNTGTVVDQFSVTVLGTPAVWTTAVPAVLSLFPGADGTIELHFAPPRTAEIGAGPVPYAVRVDASQDPDGSVVEEGDVDLLPFVEVQAKLTPRTSETKRKARHEVLVDNRGNSPVEAEIDASDPDEQLAFEVKPRTVTVPAGQSVHVPVKVAAKKGFLRGTDKHRPFNVRVNVGQGHAPINLDGTLMQKPGMPRFIVPLVGAAVILALAALVLPALKKDDRSGILSLTSDGSATTTTAPEGETAAADEPEDPNAPATPEEQAAAAEAERLANGDDGSPSGGSTSGGTSGGETTSAGGATSSGSGGTTSGGSTAGGTSGGSTSGGSTASPDATSPPATAATPPSTTTTVASGGGAAPAPTTTAAPRSTSRSFVGSWRAKDGSFMAIGLDKVNGMQVKADTSFAGAFTCTGSIADADDDGRFSGSCSDRVTHVFTHVTSSDQVQVTYTSSSTFCPRGGCVATFFRA